MLVLSKTSSYPQTRLVSRIFLIDAKNNFLPESRKYDILAIKTKSYKLTIKQHNIFRTALNWRLLGFLGHAKVQTNHTQIRKKQTAAASTFLSSSKVTSLHDLSSLSLSVLLVEIKTLK